MNTTIRKLLSSDEPSVRFKVLVNVLGKEPGTKEIKDLQEDIRDSARAKLLLSERDDEGRIPFHPYAKWYGAHWVLATLADIGYPSGDESLIPLREQVYAWLFSTQHEEEIVSVEGRARIHASQEGNALYSLLSLGLADDRTEELVKRLIRRQWLDGGWNCDRKPEAVNSSFHESLIPLRGLALHGRITGEAASKASAECAADIFLKRRPYRRQKDGRIMNYSFVKLHYPSYWHYEMLSGLKVMAEAGFIGDERCNDALDLLQSKRLPNGGFPAESKYYRVTERRGSGRSLVDWGGTSKRQMNDFVTADALYVLNESGRGDTIG